MGAQKNKNAESWVKRGGLACEDSEGSKDWINNWLRVSHVIF